MSKQFCIIGLIVLEACSTLPEAEKGGFNIRDTLHSVALDDGSYTSPFVVTVEPAALEGFGFLYKFIDETEFVLCLEGVKKTGSIRITGFRLAEMTSTSVYKVAYIECGGKDYLGTAHNHPPTNGEAKLCYQSGADQGSFESDKRAVIDIILCGEHKLLWVLKDGRSKVENRETAAK